MTYLWSADPAERLGACGNVFVKTSNAAPVLANPLTSRKSMRLAQAKINRSTKLALHGRISERGFPVDPTVKERKRFYGQGDPLARLNELHWRGMPAGFLE